MLPKEILSALIAFFGVALSGFVALLVSRRVVFAETRKMRFEAKKLYDHKLLEYRLKAYPSLYFLLSDFIKLIERQSVAKDRLESLLSQIDDWDSHHAIVFSKYTGLVCHRFRRLLREHLQEGDDSLIPKLSSRDFLQNLKDEAARLELALKSDLGIYGIKQSEPEFDVVVMDRYGRFRDEYGRLQLDQANARRI